MRRLRNEAGIGKRRSELAVVHLLRGPSREQKINSEFDTPERDLPVTRRNRIRTDVSAFHHLHRRAFRDAGVLNRGQLRIVVPRTVSRGTESFP